MEVFWLLESFEKGFYTSNLDEWIHFLIKIFLDKLSVKRHPVLAIIANVLLPAQ